MNTMDFDSTKFPKTLLIDDLNSNTNQKQFDQSEEGHVNDDVMVGQHHFNVDLRIRKG